MSSVYKYIQLPALIAIIFAHGFIPAIPIPLFVFAQIIPAT